MSAEPLYLDAWKTLPMVGQTYEFQTMGSETFVGTVKQARIGPGGRLYIETDERTLNTILPLGYRPCVVEPKP